MIDLGDFIPTAATPPMRVSDGETTLGRLTTTEEQRLEAIEKIVQAAGKRGEDGARATVIWSNSDPTILEVTVLTEHVNGLPIYFPDRVTEFTPSGGEISPSEEARVRTLVAEVGELHEKGML